MAKRQTDTEKWNDPWFVSLSPEQKITFLFLCDMCAWTGVYEISVNLISFYLKIDQSTLNQIFKDLKRMDDRFSVNGKFILIKKFIQFQQKLPLNPENNCHKTIIHLIQTKHGVLFPELKKYLRALEAPSKGLIRSPSKSNSKGKVKVDVKVDIKDEIKNLKSLGLSDKKIKDHLLMREIPEVDIDLVMGRKF